MDLAIFGNQPKGKCLDSKKFRRFSDQLAMFDDFNQAYDLLYYKTGKNGNSMIMDQIEKQFGSL